MPQATKGLGELGTEAMQLSGVEGFSSGVVNGDGGKQMKGQEIYHKERKL